MLLVLWRGAGGLGSRGRGGELCGPEDLDACFGPWCVPLERQGQEDGSQVGGCGLLGAEGGRYGIREEEAP